MKDLKDMTLEELWQIFPIELKSRNDDYPLWYSEKAEEIGQIIGKDIFSINHIGSTAVNIIAKPIIDILVEIKDGADISNVAEKLQANGWQVMSRGRERISLNMGYTTDGFLEKVYHLHIRKLGDNDEIYFKEYLIANPVVADEYVALKQSVKFYKEIFDLEIIADYGENKTLTGGISLNALDAWMNFAETDTVIFQNNAVELYFEEEDMDDFIAKLYNRCDVNYVHRLKEHSWGQRVVRIYDPDFHIIEIGENISSVAKRFQASGMSVREVAERMDIPAAYAENLLK